MPTQPVRPNGSSKMSPLAKPVADVKYAGFVVVLGAVGLCYVGCKFVSEKLEPYANRALDAISQRLPLGPT